MRFKLDEAISVCRLYFPKQPISRQFIRTPCKQEQYTRPRWFIMAYLREAGFSFPQIAHMVGMRDHTTVMHGVKKAHGLWGKLLFEQLYAHRNEPPETATRFTNNTGWHEPVSQVA